MNLLTTGSLCGDLQEVPALLNLPSDQLGSPVWLIMTGTTIGIRGYNTFLAKIEPLTGKVHFADLVPFMVVSDPPEQALQDMVDW